jgi:hypothetical protein
MFIQYIQNFLTIDECDFLINLGESVGLEQMKSSKIVNGKVVEEGLLYSGNKRMGCYFVDDLLSTTELKFISNKVLFLSNKLNPYKGISYTSIPKYSFNRYSDGDFLDWHSDSHEIISGATITFIIQLNDDYEEGDVKYKMDDVEYSVPKQKGSVLVFDSNIQHSVDIIKSGIRYSMNVWPTSIKKISLL